MAFLVFIKMLKEGKQKFSFKNSFEKEDLLISSASQHFEWSFIPYQDLNSSLRGFRIYKKKKFFYKKDVTWLYNAS